MSWHPKEGKKIEKCEIFENLHFFNIFKRLQLYEASARESGWRFSARSTYGIGTACVSRGLAAINDFACKNLYAVRRESQFLRYVTPDRCYFWWAFWIWSRFCVSVVSVIASEGRRKFRKMWDFWFFFSFFEIFRRLQLYEAPARESGWQFTARSTYWIRMPRS